ncbi:MAG: hypothetical protein ACSHW0_05020 [Thalassotalea sp.]
MFIGDEFGEEIIDVPEPSTFVWSSLMAGLLLVNRRITSNNS